MTVPGCAAAWPSQGRAQIPAAAPILLLPVCSRQAKIPKFSTARRAFPSVLRGHPSVCSCVTSAAKLSLWLLP